MKDQSGCLNCAVLSSELQQLHAQVALLNERLDKLADLCLCDSKDVTVQTDTPCQTDCSVQASIELEYGTQSDNVLECANDLLDCAYNLSSGDTSLFDNTLSISNISNKLVPNSINIFSYDNEAQQLIEPYALYPGAPFSDFNVTKLEKTTIYTNTFENRTVAYYSDYPYHYSGITHRPNSISSNTYLCEILDHVKSIMPNFYFNSAMLTKYHSGSDNLPYHSDNEDDISPNSDVVTISLGESRTIKFRAINKSQSELSVRLHHGSVFSMTKASQSHFEHSIPKDFSKYPRISITLRQIQSSNQTSGITSTQVLAGLSDTQNKNIGNGHEPPSFDGYQPNVSIPPSHFLHSHVEEFSDCIHPSTLYISSSMFRDLSAVKLSSKNQKAEVLFFPGATAGDMLSRLKHDPKFKCMYVCVCNQVHTKSGMLCPIATNSVSHYAS